MGILEVLTVVFITLKLAGAIDWSWWTVLAPLWGAVVFWVAAILIFFTSLRWMDRL